MHDVKDIMDIDKEWFEKRKKLGKQKGWLKGLEKLKKKQQKSPKPFINS